MSAQQLAIEFCSAVVAVEWCSGCTFEGNYTHIIRSPDDPERAKRGTRGQTSTSWKDVLSTKPSNIDALRAAILRHLADETPRTFNRLCVELTGYTADVAFEEGPDIALKQLVRASLVEHSMSAPILFRLREVT